MQDGTCTVTGGGRKRTYFPTKLEIPEPPPEAPTDEGRREQERLADPEDRVKTEPSDQFVAEQLEKVRIWALGRDHPFTAQNLRIVFTDLSPSDSTYMLRALMNEGSLTATGAGQERRYWPATGPPPPPSQGGPTPEDLSDLGEERREITDATPEGRIMARLSHRSCTLAELEMELPDIEVQRLRGYLGKLLQEGDVKPRTIDGEKRYVAEL